MEPIARKTDWRVSQNPFEGGSDHDVFLPLRVPSVISWYYPDIFMGSNLDTPDKVSPEEMKNVAKIHGIAALILASAKENDTYMLLNVLERKAQERFKQELATSKKFLMDIADCVIKNGKYSVEIQVPIEIEFLKRWARWYDDALFSAKKIPVGGDIARLSKEIQDVRARCSHLADHYERELADFAQYLIGLKK